MKYYYERTGYNSFKQPYRHINRDYVVELIRERFQTLPQTLVKKLMKLYQRDFEYFGYTYDIRTSTAGGFTWWQYAYYIA